MPAQGDGPPLLFTPLDLRQVTSKNRIVISPMCQYSAVDGMPDDWHFAHLAKFAMGGAGIVFVEATAVEERGRITFGDVGIYTEAQAKAFLRITDFLKAHGSLPAIQIAHAGRKGAMQRPWQGNGPMGEADAARGERPWPIVGPSAVPVDAGWLVPQALDADDIASIRDAFVVAAKRSLDAGFQILEIHGAHGYLIQSFLSPIANRRNDAYGGDRDGRMRLALEVTEGVRAVWPRELPLFFRISSVDGVEGGWQIEDSVALARELHARGVDVIDCSSGGIAGPATAARVKRLPGFQVPFAERIRQEVGMMTQAVGLIMEPQFAEDILQDGRADLIAIGREALYDPFWPRHAADALGVGNAFADWPEQYGWWLANRARNLARDRAG